MKLAYFFVIVILFFSSVNSVLSESIRSQASPSSVLTPASSLPANSTIAAQIDNPDKTVTSNKKQAKFVKKPNRPNPWQPSDTPADSESLQRYGPIAEGTLTPYGEEVIPDNDIRIEDPNAKAERYKNGRMAFLFGQYDQALKIWEPLANEGYAKAQATLAWMYHTGKGLKKDYSRAFYWYKRAANQSHPVAINNLGVFYEQGLGIPKNIRVAAEKYRDAAEWGYSFAQYNLGILYKNGQGVAKDKKKAIYWLQVAALQDVPQAKEALIALGEKVDIPEHEPLKLKSKPSQPIWHRKENPKSIPQPESKTVPEHKTESMIEKKASPATQQK